jgi:hypothetical protein
MNNYQRSYFRLKKEDIGFKFTFLIAKIIKNYFFMIENHGFRKVAFCINPHFFCVISRLWDADSLGYVNRGYGVMPGITVWLRIRVELFFKFDVQRCFFFCLPDSL